MLVLGINEGSNSSVALCRDGRVFFALQEERVCGEKNFFGFPHEALRFAFEHCSLSPADFDAVCLSNLRSRVTTKTGFLRGYDVTAGQAGPSLRTKLGRLKGRVTPATMRRSAADDPGVTVIAAALESHGFGSHPTFRHAHHDNHAATAYYGMRRDPEREHLVLTLDGGGDGLVSTVSIGSHQGLRRLAETPRGASIGNIYSLTTHLLGFTPHEHEYKLMGLAPYCPPEQAEQIADVFRSYLALDRENPLTFRCLVPEGTGYLGPRLARDLRRSRFDFVAGGLQRFTEELVVGWVRAAVRSTGVARVCAAGGVFMNVKVNKLIAELPEVESFGVFPSCGDETLSFGTAWNRVGAPGSGGQPGLIEFDSFSLGPDPTFDQHQALERNATSVHQLPSSDVATAVAALLEAGFVVAHCVGPMEFGARALGNRSLLADPTVPGVVAQINSMIKLRDFWMPFAPAVLDSDADRYLRVAPSLPRPNVSPYMMQAFDSLDNRDDLAAALHPHDRTARAQTVSKALAPGLHAVLEAFRTRTGRSALLNTSFNIHGEPLVMGTTDAIRVLLTSSLEVLALHDRLVVKPHALERVRQALNGL